MSSLESTTEQPGMEAVPRAVAGINGDGTETGDTLDERPARAVDLSERDREILALERVWWKYAGAKEQAIREKFDMSTTRYYQILNGLLDSRAALEFDPLLVKRLRRMRASRQRTRSARRLGIEP